MASERARSSGKPERKAKSQRAVPPVSMRQKQRQAIRQFANDPTRVRRSARAYFELVEKGEIDVAR